MSLCGSIPSLGGFFSSFFALVSNKNSGEIDPEGEIWLNFLKISKEARLASERSVSINLKPSCLEQIERCYLF